MSKWMKNACFASIIQEETIVGAHVKMGLTSQLSLDFCVEPRKQKI